MKTAILLIAFFISIQSGFSSDWKHAGEYRGFVIGLNVVNDTSVFVLTRNNGDPGEASVQNWIHRYSSNYRDSAIYGVNSDEAFQLFKQSCGNSVSFSSPSPYKHYLSFLETTTIVVLSNDSPNIRGISTGLTSYIREIKMLDSTVGVALFVDEQIPLLSYAFTMDDWNSFEVKRFPNRRGVSNLKYINDEEIFYRKSNDPYPNTMFAKLNVYNGDYTELGKIEPHNGLDHNRQNIIYDYSFLDDTTIVGVGGRRIEENQHRYDIIVKSTNGGLTWQKKLDTIFTDVNAWGLHFVSFRDYRNGVAVGPFGKIHMTRDGGDTWLCEDPRPEHFYRGGDTLSGPVATFVKWAGKTPIIGTRMGGNIYRYEGDYFDWSIAAPRLFEPKNWVKGQKTELKFRWEEVEGINQYHFELAKDKEFTEIIEDQMVNDTELDVSGLETHTTYHWRVTISHEGEEYISREFYFRTKFDDIETITPDCNAIDQSTDLELSWTPAGGAEYYHLQIADSANFNSVIYDLDSLSETSYEMTDLDSGRTYYWRVQSLDYKERSDWSEVCSFTTDHPTSVLSFLDAGEIELTQFRDELQITINGGSAIDYDFSLYNLQGSEIIRQPISRNRHVNVIRINDLHIGTYFYRVSSKGVAVLQDKLIVVE